MITVRELIQELSKFPADARCYVNDGDHAGLVVQSADGTESFGHIATGDVEAVNTANEIVY